MKNRKLLPADSTADHTEITRVRSEVQRALRTDPPDLGALTSALERVDALISEAQAELLCAVRELQRPHVVPTAKSDRAAQTAPCGWHLLLW